MSNMSDVAGTREDMGKEKVPKRLASCIVILWAYNQEINYDKLDEMFGEQIEGGTDAIVICGTTGESATMSEQEHIDVIRFAIDRVNHRVPVIAGTSSNCTATAVQLSKEAAEAGADALLIMTP